MRWQILWCVMFLTIVVSQGAAAPARGEEYATYREAMSAASKFMKERSYAAAQAPLEAALKLAPSDAERLRIYNNLMAAYRLLPENDKMIEACEFTMANTREDAERSITARSLTSFLFQRGKLDAASKTYQDRLAKEPDELVSLAMMTAISGVHPNDSGAAKDYQARLEKVQQQRNANLAAAEETLAAANPAQATDHWKQAAIYRVRAAQNTKAIEDAKQAELTGPDKRSQILLHYWHAQLGDVFLSAGAPKEAIPHFEQAIATTSIAGAKERCEKQLTEAKAKVAEQK